MTEQLSRLSSLIRSELREVSESLGRMREARQRVERTGDEFYLDSVALSLHAAYGGIERIFERIAAVIDLSVPTGADWHQKILHQVASDMVPLRPAAISIGTRDALESYRGFRHVVRHTYPFRLNPDKVRQLMENAEAIFARTQTELSAFADWLERSDTRMGQP